jgi:hypothetical protein
MPPPYGVCNIIIGVVSVVSQYNCVYYCIVCIHVAYLRRGLADGARVVSADERLRVGDDGLEDAHERVGELEVGGVYVYKTVEKVGLMHICSIISWF